MTQKTRKSRVIRPDQLMRAIVDELGGTTGAAKALGLSISFTSLLKTGGRSPSRKTVTKISGITGIRRDWLMFGLQLNDTLDNEGIRALVRCIMNQQE